jgi:hypothetical protein
MTQLFPTRLLFRDTALVLRCDEVSGLHQLCEHQAPSRKIALHRPREAVAQVSADVERKTY